MGINKNKIIKLVEKHAGFSITPYQNKITEETLINSEFDFDDDEIQALMSEFFEEFNVNPDGFNINNYYYDYSDHSFLSLLNPFKKVEKPALKALSIAMLIESAKLGHWLYD
ncbi:DUF1493 family protein [Dickeya parazeae]|uniref:DUF1493 family protein n=1 Tax=Dickeya zeae (strain Ech586) TaxID=590409 RepID=D2BY60_DICZ5|nr:DUF1493 family protein [Dickeya parazeae]ACZ78652.1 protein of unknown function DUF1493 [Dickeya parazeae Ech586]MBP2837468.1 DUF1493 family protein [Dickeya parazeae]